MSLSFEALLAALKSASASTTSSTTFNAEEVVMKLAKKDEHALLSFEIPGQTRSGQRVRVVHDVKIEVMKPADSDKLKEPMCPKADVCTHPVTCRKVIKHSLSLILYPVDDTIATAGETAHYSRPTAANGRHHGTNSK